MQIVNKKYETIKYIISDFLSASIAWGVFYIYRKVVIENNFSSFDSNITLDNNFYLGLVIIPSFWVFLYYAIGSYKDVFRKARLKEFGETLLISIIGVTVIFFVLILDDQIISYKSYYKSYTFLFGLHFSITYLFKYIHTKSITYKVHNKIIGFNTIMVGSNQNALDLYTEMNNSKKSSGNIFIGFVSVLENKTSYLLENEIKHLGSYKNLKNIIEQNSIEEVIIAIESNEHEKLSKILNELYDTNVIIKVIPDMYDIMSGTVKMTSIWASPLIVISPELMPLWQKLIKRFIDITVSLIVLILFFPGFIITALLVKQSSKGPIFYTQERIGLHGVKFKLIKFRSMYLNSEKEKPMLSITNDPRITPWGRFIRKTRIDETPQFLNILKGDMSLVGYRPEREYFIEKIVEKAPHYNHLLKIKPGMTSWGQVKYGYAESVDEMIERLKYDIMYIENMNLALDLKILIYTVLIVFQGRGQ